MKPTMPPLNPIPIRTETSQSSMDELQGEPQETDSDEIVSADGSPEGS